MYQITKQQNEKLKKGFAEIEKKYKRRRATDANTLVDIHDDIVKILQGAITTDADKIFNVQVWNEENEIKLKIRPEITVECQTQDPKKVKDYIDCYMNVQKFLNQTGYVKKMNYLCSLLEQNTVAAQKKLQQYFGIEQKQEKKSHENLQTLRKQKRKNR